ncbi:MAG: SMI1/KNR4 family protein [Planctomycetes bacterium]|nr:SMI1/KNR4 family protein [Planctomycetota bacterium]
MGKWREAFDHGRPSRWDIEYRLEYTFGPPATEEQLARVEGQLGVRLPAEVRELLSEFNGVWYTSEAGRMHGGESEIVFLDTECMTDRVPRYLRYGGDPPITPGGADLRKVVFVAQVNGFADLYGVCLELVARFTAGAVVRLDHETGELTAEYFTLREFVEYGLKPA